jgi:hypothetical protein
MSRQKRRASLSGCLSEALSSFRQPAVVSRFGLCQQYRKFGMADVSTQKFAALPVFD